MNLGAQSRPSATRPSQGVFTRTARIYFDVTFSSWFGASVGVTRTVRRLFAEVEAQAAHTGFTCIPVVFNASGFRELPRELVDSAAGASPGRPQRAIATSLAKLLGRLHLTPCSLWLQQLLWPLLCGREFNGRSRDLPAIRPDPGDVLFLSDASWTYRVWRATRVARRTGATVITVVYDLIPLRHPEYSTPLNTLALREWLKRQLPRSDAVLCISRAVEEDLRSYARDNCIQLGVTTTFRLGCDHVAAGADRRSIRQTMVDFVTGGPCFSAVGSIEPRKNHALLLDSFDRLWNQGIEVRLLLIGGCTPQSYHLLNRIHSHPQFGKFLLVVLDGNDAEVAFAYEGSRALLLPSSAEGFGLPLVEARSHGCRVIASDLGVFKELADGGVSTFPLKHPESLDGLILRHLQDATPPPPVTPFTWADSALQCLALIHDLTSVAANGTSAAVKD